MCYVQEKKNITNESLIEDLRNLAVKFKLMEALCNLPTTTNFTISKDRFMFGASICIGIPKHKLTRKNIQENNASAASARVDVIPSIKGSTHVEMPPGSICGHPWGNCSEATPWEALRGEDCSIELNSLTITLKDLEEKVICYKCNEVAKTIKSMGVAKVVPMHLFP
ncbi:unnamed protein product [Rhizophagus irregularis]|uniref:Uncharacterized protein n=1 Tax=Rhizophagus irregularis TaxID=588596 RepID=A0A2N1ML83_9GLOM|nr:hypothetical protein RhiirC2_814893 [Rhizophagus irregularis]CAB4397189.1 unnamed protein product [Rhizophagus irregularis]CAB5365816.1 unnamed protein product [Rhizophagus irregularis]